MKNRFCFLLVLAGFVAAIGVANADEGKKPAAKPVKAEAPVQASQNNDVIIVRSRTSPDMPGRDCSSKTIASVDLRKTMFEANIANLDGEIQDYVKKIKSQAAGQGVTVTVSSLNYSANQARGGGFDMAADGGYRVNMAVTLMVDPADKAAALVQSLGDAGLSANLNVRMNNPCVRRY
jgi:hypothetical protein